MLKQLWLLFQPVDVKTVVVVGSVVDVKTGVVVGSVVDV